ncbi:CmpA/NrtA family ABC transporter substrate-binding protein [Rhizobium sp.]|jgi:two-component system, oxyanion-binding sensor|uniref:CmpA/NrtA family ABC transporter substrate-binding protein n=1 Tax=Rhizobium sp. TaxID=391 RepID=UPI000E89C6F4|nr:nitrate transporter [Rhizobium sp.]
MEVTLGYMPFVDSAALVVASEKGFAADEGLKLRLVRETSWANIRDRLAVGHFHGAHMPAPLALAANLGLYPVSPSLLVVMTLNLAGGAITASNALYAQLTQAGLGEGLVPQHRTGKWEPVFGKIRCENNNLEHRADSDLRHDALDPIATGAALKAVVANRTQQGLPRLRFALGFEHSGQGYQLRYWLSACGIKPGVDVEMVALPSPLMADAVAEGAIDGFCAAEPWNSLAVQRQVGRIVTTSTAIWRDGPDKVLGISRKWSEDNRPELDALVRALHRAAQWCGNPDNIEELAGILAAPRHLGVDGGLLLPALTGEVVVAPGVVRQVDGFLVLERKAAGFPWESQGLWFYSQMVRAGHVVHSAANRQTVLDTYRPDLYRRALKPMFAPMPGANRKLEGALSRADYVGSTTGSLMLGPDGFFDGRIFDPDDIEHDLGA